MNADNEPTKSMHDVDYLKDESYQLIGAAFEVCNDRGFGLPKHEAQLLSYPRITKRPLGYVINFGEAGGLDFKRIILSEFLPK